MPDCLKHSGSSVREACHHLLVLSPDFLLLSSLFSFAVATVIYMIVLVIIVIIIAAAAA